MHELFGSQQNLEIELFYKIEKTKNGQVVPLVITEDEYNKLKVDDKQKDKAKSLRTQWRMPTWRAANELLEASTYWNHMKQENDINWNRYRDQRLKALLLSWDAKTPTGEDIPCNEETINMLHQNIALSLLNKYDEATRVTEEDEVKN